jgi:hypothetical protein
MSTTEQKIDELLNGFEDGLARGEDPRTSTGLLQHIQLHGTPVQLMRRERLILTAEHKFPDNKRTREPDPLDEVLARAMGLL